MAEEAATGAGRLTDPQLTRVLEDLRRREPVFHRRELGTTRADFEAQTAADFWEVGASGRRYGRELVWATLEKRYATEADDVWEVDDFHCRGAGAGTYLLTYTLRQGERVTRRLSVWQQTEDDWQIVFHQGTVVDDQDDGTNDPALVLRRRAGQ